MTNSPEHSFLSPSLSQLRRYCTKVFALLLLPLLLQAVSIPAPGAGEDRAIYLVHVEGDGPVAFEPEHAEKFSNRSGSSVSLAKNLVDLHDELLQSSLAEGTYQKLYSFNHIFNGFAVHTTPSQAGRLAAAPGVKLLERDRQAKLMTTYTPAFLGLPGVWAEGGGEKTAGEGVVIGIIDTGINPAHPSFANDPENPFRPDWRPQFDGACEMSSLAGALCNGKIVSARHFSAGAAAVFPLNASRELSPVDEVGHGTHVASVAAGNWGVPVVVGGFKYGTASGMAPRARIAVYKAIYPEGGTTADVISAIDQAAQDGVHILILSIGPDEPPEGIPSLLSAFEISLLFARRAGIFVVQAGGNKGPSESTTISVSPWTVGAAAGTTDRKFQATIKLDDGIILQGVGLTGPSYKDGFPFKPLVAAKDAIAKQRGSQISPAYADECQHPEALEPAVVQGTIVICNFSVGFFNGSSTVTSTLNTAKVLGFAGFILVANPILGDFVAEPLPFTIPGIMIPKVSDVQILLDYYEKTTYRDPERTVTRYGGRASIGEGRIASFDEGAPVVARFSSRGPDVVDRQMNAVDVLKPDILAPGSQIWAAWSPISALEPILRGEDFALLSGTSMAAPHIAGIAALIKQFKPTWDPSEIASAISTTASGYDGNGIPIMSQGSDPQSLYPSTPFDRGAGLVNPSRALNPGLVFPSGFKDYISFLCSSPSVDREMVKSTTNRACGSPESSPADLNLPSITIASLRGLQMVRRRVKNMGDVPETYLSSVRQPRGVRVYLKPSLFTIQPQGTQDIQIELKVTEALEGFSFGEIVLVGSLDHIVRLPMSIFPVAVI
ncbi:unnamed protein product [Spirodela intermedia]|uniref:Uncharacterized protein n=1 Tax=Spirodela intermedia TaxID=51605 RepID=A0A7I8LCR2_SPIIN|nr:unnamed protein product [Spirodela intermedia]